MSKFMTYSTEEQINIMEEAIPCIDRIIMLSNEYAELSESYQSNRAVVDSYNSIGGFLTRQLTAGKVPIVGLIKNHQDKKNMKKSKEQSEILADRMVAVQNEIKEQARKCGNTGIFQFIPHEYLKDLSENPVAVIYRFFAIGRADTMKEALQLFEEYKHRNKMEMLQEATLYETQRGNSLLETNNKIAAMNLAVNIFQMF